MLEWNQIKLGEIAEFRNGVNFSKDSFGSGIKVINVGDFKDRMYPDYNSLSELDSSKKWHKDCFLEKNDIIFVRSNGNKALIGRSIFIKELPETPVTFSAFSIRLRFKKEVKLVPKFYLYLFKSPLFRALLSQFGNGTNISNLNQDILNNLVVPNPPFEIQTEIASTLSTFDDLIDNNNQRIHLLEEMAEEIYKEWFVRMRFPNYQDTIFFDKKGIEVPFGIKEALPEEWKKVKFGDLCEVGRGSSPRPISDQKYFNGGDIPWIKIADATASKMFIYETKEYVNEFGASFSRRLSKGSLIIATSGTLGFSIFLGVEGCIHDGWMYLSNYEENFTPEFMFYTINVNKTYLNNLSYGAAIQNINTEIIRKIPMIKPDLDTLKKFNEIIKPLHSKIDNLSKKNKVLQQTRNLLLPRLINGKLNVEHLATI